jgi:hypothetical protein
MYADELTRLGDVSANFLVREIDFFGVDKASARSGAIARADVTVLR